MIKPNTPELIEPGPNVIEPGTPVRCKDTVSDRGTTCPWFYVGPLRTGGHIAEDEGGGYIYWSYVEPLPRELKKGDRVAVSDVSLANAKLEVDDSWWIFDGMYGDVFICTTVERISVAAWKYAVHVDDKES